MIELSLPAVLAMAITTGLGVLTLLLLLLGTWAQYRDKRRNPPMNEQEAAFLEQQLVDHVASCLEKICTGFSSFRQDTTRRNMSKVLRTWAGEIITDYRNAHSVALGQITQARTRGIPIQKGTDDGTKEG